MSTRKRKRRSGLEITMTAQDQYIFQRASLRQEQAYKRADRDDALVALYRLQRGGVVACITGKVRP